MRKVVKVEAKRNEPGFFKSGAIVTVAGADSSFGPGGFTVGGWDETAEARVEHGGPNVKGPHVYIYGLCGVIDNHGGTGAIHDKAKAEEKFFAVEVGDELEINGLVYVVGLTDRRYPTLTVKHSERHGGCFDRGGADSYYGRGRNPHYYVGKTEMSARVEKIKMTESELEAYEAGYVENEASGCFKDWG